MDQNYNKYHRDKQYQKMEKTFKNIFKKRVGLILRFKNKGRVLDVGCTNGVMLDLFKQYGFETWGVEPSQNAKIASKKGHKVVNAYFENAKLPKNYFDLVVLNHTLEHLDKPTEILRKAFELLKKDGVLYVDVPNAGGLGSKLLGMRWPLRLPNEHKWQFTKTSLEKVFVAAGFKPIYFESRSGIFEYANPLTELGHRRFIFEVILSPYAFLATILNMGDSMSMIGKKSA